MDNLSDKVSVIIPNYNHSEYLNLRIQSVIKQSYDNTEIIILDDKSTDSSRDIIEKYRSHSKVSHIIYNDKNVGNTFKQWEKGIKLATGDWIWIAESDDWCEPTLLSELLSIRNKKTVISFCGSTTIRDNKILFSSKHEYLVEDIDGNDFIDKYMIHGNKIFNASMCIFKKSYFDDISDVYKNYSFVGDWLFWIEMASKGRVSISGKILNYFRKHNKDISSHAYSNGVFYKEYISALDHLVNQNVIDKKKENMLLFTQMKKMINNNIDKTLIESYKNKIPKSIICRNYISKKNMKNIIRNIFS